MNAISLFGASPSAGVWFGILLVLSALSMASAPPEWRWQIRQPRTIPLCVSASGLLGLAMASTMAAIMRPELFADAPRGGFELPATTFAKAQEQGRLFGLRLEGVWMHVGTPDAIAAAENAILASVA